MDIQFFRLSPFYGLEPIVNGQWRRSFSNSEGPKAPNPGQRLRVVFVIHTISFVLGCAQNYSRGLGARGPMSRRSVNGNRPRRFHFHGPQLL